MSLKIKTFEMKFYSLIHLLMIKEIKIMNLKNKVRIAAVDDEIWVIDIASTSAPQFL